MKQGELFGPAPAKKAREPSRKVRNEAVAPEPVIAPPQEPAWRRPTEPARAVLSVGELTRQIKTALERGFTRVTVRGEISGFRGPNPRGHLYFSLKDAEACIDARIWAGAARGLKFKLKDGLAVIAEGSVDVYEPAGRYSLIVSRIEPEGVGALALAFEQLKERLAAEGLFGERRKRPPRPLPQLPRRIGVVTSVTGAALRDFLRVLHGRHPRLPVLVCDARVQGEGAAREVARAISWLARTDVDVIVVTRGGGSIEDLWAFNEELVARAIHASPVPVVSAVGHEVDVTIADFVADFRAPTPSAAAERLAPVLHELEHGLATQAHRLRKAAERHVLEDRQRLTRLASRLADPRRALGQRRLALSEQADALERLLRRSLARWREGQQRLAERLQRNRPQAKLAERRDELRLLTARLQAAIRKAQRSARERHAGLAERLGRRRPDAQVQRRRQELRGLEQRLVGQLRVLLRRRAEELDAARMRSRLVGAARQSLGARRAGFEKLVGSLEAMSPLAVLSRGYSIAFRSADGHVLRRAEDVAAGEEIVLRLAPAGVRRLEEADRIDAQVVSTRKGGGAGG